MLRLTNKHIGLFLLVVKKKNFNISDIESGALALSQKGLIFWSMATLGHEDFCFNFTFIYFYFNFLLLLLLIETLLNLSVLIK